MASSQRAKLESCQISHWPWFCFFACGKSQWWNKIGTFSGCEFVISADKRPHHYDRFGVPDKLLFLVKDPRAHIVSWAKRNFLQAEQTLKDYNEGSVDFELSDSQFEQALFIWLRETRKHISWCLETKKDFAVVSLESFVRQDELILIFLGRIFRA